LTLRRMAQVFGLQLDKETAEDRVVSGWNSYQQRFAAG
jgi:hypothetical protein